MWEIYSTFAPKPLLLEQGHFDDLIPIDLAQRNARKVENVYIQVGARENFRFAFTQEKHSWVESDILEVSNFLAPHLGVDVPSNDMPPEELLERRNAWSIDVLSKSLTTAEIAEAISGIAMPDGTELWDIFKPKFCGREITEDEIVPDLGRGSVMRVLAQLECTLNGETKPYND